MTERRRAFGHGTGALLKSALLVAGVPSALVRLWALSGPPGDPWSAQLGARDLAARAVLLAVAVAWCWAVASLWRDIRRALRHRTTAEPGSWSARWAAAIAGLIFAATAGGGIGAAVALRPRPAAVAGLSTRPAAGAASSAAPVGAGDCLADVARRSGSALDWAELARLNLDRLQPDGARFVDPNLLRPGWCLGVGVRAPDGPLSPPAQAGSRARPNEAEELALLGLGVVATAALVRRLGALRRVRECLRRPGERPARPPTAIAAAEGAVAPFGEATLIDWIEVANRLLWRACVDRRREDLPAVRLVRAGPDGVEFLLDKPLADVPRPFSGREGGRFWVLEPGPERDALARLTTGCGRYEPRLIPVGDDGEAAYLAAPAPGRPLSLDGDPVLVDRVVAGMALALRALPWADELAVELLGLPAPPVGEHAYQLATSTAATLAELCANTRAASRLASTWQREPLALVDRTAADEKTVELATALGGVVAAPAGGGDRLVLDTATCVLLPYGLRLRPVAPDAGAVELVEALLANACREPEVLPVRVNATPAPTGPFEPAGAGLRLLVARPHLVGNALGPPLGPGDGERAVELVAFLALHGGSSRRAEVRQALFKRHEPRRGEILLSNTAAAARRALGTTAGGESRLRADSDLLELVGDVASDWVWAIGAAAAARTATPEAARAALEAALGCLEASPASNVSWGYDWLAYEGLLATLTAELVDAAHHLANLTRARGELDVARWAIDKGRLLEPASEMLARDLMVLLDAAGERQAVPAVMEQLEVTLQELAGVEPSPETLALFEALVPEGGGRARGRPAG